MTEFAVFTTKLNEVIGSVRNLAYQKSKFAKSISFQVAKLHKAIHERCQNDFPFIKDLESVLFVNQSEHITPQVLCYYLSLNLSHLNRNYSIFSLKDTDINDFQKIVVQDMNIRRQLRLLLQPSKQNLEERITLIFEEIDFFNNGYITVQSFKEFIRHYNQSLDQEHNDSELLHIMQIIRNCRVAQKIYLEDLTTFAKQYYSSPDDAKQQLVKQQANNKEIVKFEQRKYRFDNFLLQKQAKTYRKNRQEQGEGRVRSFQQTARWGKRQNSVQRKLITSHSRNQKYIQMLNKQNSLAKKSSFTKMNQTDKRYLVQDLVNSRKTMKTEMMLQLKKILNNFNRRKKAVQDLIQNNPKFTFLDGFSLIDPQQHKLLIEDDFIAFLNDQKIKFQSNKASLFFKKYSKANVMEYSSFLKIFKIRSLQRLYQSCKKRSALIAQIIPNQIVQNFICFISTVIKLTYQQQKLKEEFAVLIQKENQQLFQETYLSGQKSEREDLTTLIKDQQGILSQFDGLFNRREQYASRKDYVLDIVLKI